MSCLQNWKLLQKKAFQLTASNIRKVYLQDGLLVVVKPYGLPMHGGGKVKHSFIKLLPQLEQKYELPAGSLELANRLDKNVPGIVMLTYTDEMASYIGHLQRSRSIEKSYLAVLVGNLRSNLSGTLKSDIVENQFENTYKQVAIIPEVICNHPLEKGMIQHVGFEVQGKKVAEAVTDYEVLDPHVNVKVQGKKVAEAVTDYEILDHNGKTCMLCEFKTNTGYKHQIRVHAAQLLNTPILGDHKYHQGPKGPQGLPLRMMQLLQIPSVKSETSKKGHFRPWQRALVPMHLFAQKVYVPGLGNGEGTLLEAKIPGYFRTTMENCDLVTNRQEIEEKEMTKRKVWGELRDSPFTSKGVTPKSIGQETSL